MKKSLKIFSYLLDIISIPIAFIYYYYYYVPILIYLYWSNNSHDLWCSYAMYVVNHKGFEYYFKMESRVISVACAGGNYTSLILLILFLAVTVIIHIVCVRKNIIGKKRLIFSVMAWVFCILAIAMVAFIKLHGAPVVIDYYENQD